MRSLERWSITPSRGERDEQGGQKYFTYDEWKGFDYHVRRGETSHKRNEKGEAVFNIEQVDEDEDNFDYRDDDGW